MHVERLKPHSQDVPERAACQSPSRRLEVIPNHAALNQSSRTTEVDRIETEQRQQSRVVRIEDDGHGTEEEADWHVARMRDTR